MSFQPNPDSLYIQSMFDRLAGRYDLFNQLTSFGLAAGWRKAALDPLKPGMKVLDLGCGTGDLALDAIKKIGNSGEVVGLDFSEKMLSIAKNRFEKLSLNGECRFRLVRGKAEDIGAESESYDLVVSGFVLRNLYQNIDPILAGVHRILRTGGQISFLDITEPKNKWVSALWQCYMNTLAALYGKLLFGKDYPALYLTESAKRFLKAGEFVEKLKGKGFRNVHARSFMFGVITLYHAVK